MPGWGSLPGKGLADLIRENAGVKITFFIFIGLLVADIGNTTTEFAGVAGSLEIFSVSKYISVPIVAVMIWVMVVKGNYKIAERIFLVFSVALLMYVVSALMGKPHWQEIGHSVIHPEMKMNTRSIEMIIGIIGTTIAPWMQFYMQSSVIEKGTEDAAVQVHSRGYHCRLPGYRCRCFLYHGGLRFHPAHQ